MSTESRLETLEQELARAGRSIRWLTAAAGVAIAALCMAATPTGTTQVGKDANRSLLGVESRSNTVRATEFILADENGEVRTSLATNKIGSGLYVTDGNRVRAAQDVADGLQGLLLTDENGTTHAALNILEGKTLMVLSGTGGKVLWSTP